MSKCHLISQKFGSQTLQTNLILMEKRQDGDDKQRKKFVDLKKKVIILHLIYFGCCTITKIHLFMHVLNHSRDNTVHLFIYIKVVMFGIYAIIFTFHFVKPNAKRCQLVKVKLPVKML